MRAGRLRHIIKLKELTRVKDEYGDYNDDYNVLLVTRANVTVTSGSELIKSGAGLTSEYITILMRKNEVIKESQIVEWQGNDYRVAIIKPDLKGMQLTVTAQRDFLND